MQPDSVGISIGVDLKKHRIASRVVDAGPAGLLQGSGFRVSGFGFREVIIFIRIY